jgi:SAM-dependent methyltransferase
MLKDEMNGIYSSLLPDEIPWNIEAPPAVLTGIVESGEISPCRTLDLGCGTGNYSVYLASRGFEVTGLDLSDVAIRIARENALRKHISILFIAGDLLKDPLPRHSRFGFIFEWEVLHHVFPEQRPEWIRKVKNLLEPGGRYLSVCFHEQDPGFGGKGKYRKTSLGTELYFSNEEELVNLFGSVFRIVQLKTLEIAGRSGIHLINVALMTTGKPAA